jgi:6-pyruvoyltetrahydropterin/6-carboxytetrahydropterin synthase
MLSKDQIAKLKKNLDEIELAVELASEGKSSGPKWVIDKQFDFCYGHRVWSQQLNADYCATGDACTRCRHLHGHQGEIHVFLEADELERGMVTDFKHLGWFKNFIDDNLDHKFILDLDDPWFVQILNAKPVYENGKLKALSATQPLNTKEGREIKANAVFVPGTDHLVGYSLDISEMSGPEQEFYEGFFLVHFLPTSENLTKWMFEIVKSKMDLINVRTTRVTLNETPKSRADYSA